MSITKHVHGNHFRNLVSFFFSLGKLKKNQQQQSEWERGRETKTKWRREWISYLMMMLTKGQMCGCTLILISNRKFTMCTCLGGCVCVLVRWIGGELIGKRVPQRTTIGFSFIFITLPAVPFCLLSTLFSSQFNVYFFVRCAFHSVCSQCVVVIS